MGVLFEIKSLDWLCIYVATISPPIYNYVYICWQLNLSVFFLLSPLVIITLRMSFLNMNDISGGTLFANINESHAGVYRINSRKDGNGGCIVEFGKSSSQ
jgi:hypothetical protein